MGRPKQHFEHGTPSRYSQGCRCDDCRAAHTARMREYRSRNPEKIRAYQAEYRKRHPEETQRRHAESRERMRKEAAAEGKTYYEKYMKPLLDKKKAGEIPIPESAHGTVNGYSNHGCRCKECKTVWAAYIERRKEERAAKPIPEHVHGTQNGYGNYKCRCRPCTDAWTVATVERARRRKARK